MHSLTSDASQAFLPIDTSRGGGKSPLRTFRHSVVRPIPNSLRTAFSAKRCSISFLSKRHGIPPDFRLFPPMDKIRNGLVKIRRYLSAQLIFFLAG